MALARTAIGAYESAKTFGTGAYTTAAFTPPANSLLEVAVYLMGQGTTGDLGTPTIEGGGLTYTSRVSAFGSPEWSNKVVVFTAPVGGSPSSMTIKVDDDNNQNIYAYTVLVTAHTGYDTSTPILGTFTSGSTNIGDGAETRTFSAAPTAIDEALIYIFGDAEKGPMGPTLSAGWTKIHDAKNGGEGGIASAARTGSTSAEAVVTDVYTGGSTLFKAGMVGIIVKAATTTVTDLEGSISGAGTATGTVVAAAALSGSAQGAGVLAGSFTPVASLSGSLSGAGTLSGVLTTVANLSASASGTGTLSGELAVVANLAAGLSGTGSLAGDLTAVASLAADLTGKGELSAEVTEVIDLAASLAGTGTIGGELRAVAVLAGELGGMGTLEGTMELAPDFFVRIPSDATVDPYSARAAVDAFAAGAAIDTFGAFAVIEQLGASAEVDVRGAAAIVEDLGSGADVIVQVGTRAELV